MPPVAETLVEHAARSSAGAPAPALTARSAGRGVHRDLARHHVRPDRRPPVLDQGRCSSRRQLVSTARMSPPPVSIGSRCSAEARRARRPAALGFGRPPAFASLHAFEALDVLARRPAFLRSGDRQPIGPEFDLGAWRRPPAAAPPAPASSRVSIDGVVMIRRSSLSSL